MPQHFVIESYSGYQAVTKTLNGQKAVWYSTSPYLLEKLSKKGQEIYSLEDGLNQNEIDELAKAGYDFAEVIEKYLNEICDWRDYADLNLIFGREIFKCFFVTFYKGLLLQRLVDRLKNYSDPKVVCVGDPKSIQLTGLSLAYGRFDTLFAYLASVANQSELDVFIHTISPEILKTLDAAVRYRKMNVWEKLLSVINNTPSSFLYKTWKNLYVKRIYPFRHVCLWPYTRNFFYIYEDCELIDEMFLGLLLQGGTVGRLGPMPKVNNTISSYETLPDRERLYDKMHEHIATVLSARNLQFASMHKICAEIVSQRLLTVLERLRSNLPRLTESFDNIISSLRSGATILTNALNLLVERLFYCYCRKKKVKVVAFEHGITLGISDLSFWAVRQSGMLAADVGVYHNEKAINAIEPYAPEQKKILAGLPTVTRKIIFPSLQRRLVRRWLKIGSEEHVIMYVADLEENNYSHGPHVENDFQFLQKTNSIVRHIAKQFPQSKFILKLYPTARYVESYEFDELLKELPNLMIIKNVEFRFLRAGVDLLIVTSYQSTLGWVLGACKPCIFLEFEWGPSKLSGLRMQYKEIPDLRNVLVLNKEEIIKRCSFGELFRDLLRK